MGRSSDPLVLALHGLRLKGFAEASAVAEAAGLSAAEAEQHLEALRSEGFVMHRDGRMSGYSLTATGRAEHERRLGAELDAAAARAELDSCYRRFLELNPLLLSVCTSWQLREVAGQSVVNDHADADYDASVIGNLADLDARVQPICDELSTVFDRFASYGSRLREALERVQKGEIEFFTKPMIPSYHTVWFELHEDLLASLGIERASEGSH